MSDNRKLETALYVVIGAFGMFALMLAWAYSYQAGMNTIVADCRIYGFFGKDKAIFDCTERKP